MFIKSTLFLYLLCGIHLSKSSPQPEVKISQGVVKGLHSKTFNGRTFASFEGIPYAQPPIGNRRFKEPELADPWLGIYNATREPPLCLQIDLLVTKSILGSEDCLYINVYTPKIPKDKNESELLDVIAFIHGGAFFLGKSGFHGPSFILDRNIVLVTFNYRLGPLGFLSTEDDVVPGNNGLKDQVLALKWIKQNIAKFGGNPDSVTLGGMSAGGASCHFHLLSPLSKGLFKRAICMSGVALNPWSMGDNLKEKTMVVASDLGCPTNNSLLMINCLTSRPADHIVALTKKFLYWGSMFPLAFFGPVVEPPGPTAFLSDSPINILRKGHGSDVPVLISYALDEGLCGGGEILTQPGMFNELIEHWDDLIPHVLDYNATVPFEKRLEIGEKIKKFYEITNSEEGRRKVIRMIGDRMFVSGISKAVKISASTNQSPVYLYRFSYKGNHSMTEFIFKKRNLGVSHGDDVLYTLGFSDLYKPDSVSDIEISDQMLDVWVSFAANGSLGDNWYPVNKQIPKIVFTDIKGPKQFHLTTADQLGEESFWDSLHLNENVIFRHEIDHI